MEERDSEFFGLGVCRKPSDGKGASALWIRVENEHGCRIDHPLVKLVDGHEQRLTAEGPG